MFNTEELQSISFTAVSALQPFFLFEEKQAADNNKDTDNDYYRIVEPPFQLRHGGDILFDSIHHFKLIEKKNCERISMIWQPPHLIRFC